MTMESNEMIEFVKKELTSIIMRLVSSIEESRANQISNDIVKVIDWNNSALMHKGLSWMAKNYLIQQNMI
ncbi:MAG: hypothetical protein NC131_15690 [Roseburia sp.]|nr:hypothetical protein [Roseburia sp.]